MKILSLECSATPASAAITENGKIIASAFVNVQLTHSQTLMPMAENLLSAAALDIDDIDRLAISDGPGSFTGIRIGISAVKGLAAPRDLPCVGVSTLLSMAYNLIDRDCIVCAVMDARCNQVYNALFDIEGGKITRICDDRALMCEELAKDLKKLSQRENKCVIIVGDGSRVFGPYVSNMENVFGAPERDRLQNAVSVALAAEKMFEENKTVTADRLLPVYLRLPQAERELKKKKEGLAE